MLSLFFSNRLEALQAALLHALQAAADAARLEDEHVIVPGPALRRELTLAVARAQGVCAGLRFNTLDEWLAAQAARLHPQGAAAAALADASLPWRVFRHLADAGFADAQPRLHAWLSHADDTMRWELAGRAAELLRQLLAYRGDWLQAWSAGRSAELPAEALDEPWLAELWRRLKRELGLALPHPAQALFQALETLDGDALLAAGLPRRVHVFAPPALAPLHLALLRALARRVDVGLYVLNPCAEYWFEVVDARRIARLAQRGQALYHEVGQRLLAAWGRQTQAHLDLLLEAAAEAGEEDSAFIASGSPTLLGRLQDAVLEMRELEPGSVALAADDRSLEVHVASSRSRELEALHDTLLAAFAADATLRPSDVLVATPDLAATAPLVDAVFGTVPDARRIPYAVSGRPAGAVNAPARVLLSLLALAGSRFAAGAVFELLQSPPVARRFRLDAAALERVRGWLHAASIRWGLDGHRHAFAEGLSRLYLGYALPAEVLEPLGERLPAAELESDDAPALGAFWRFIHELRRLAQRLWQPQPPAQWRAALLEAAQALVPPDAAPPADWRALHQALNALEERQVAAGLADDKLPLPLVRAALAAQLDEGAAQGGEATGQVTFASMAALRNVPFRLVCVIGLDDGAYPAAQRPSELDLLALAPRRGDPQRRLEERNVLLDLLLAARERLVLSCVGRNERDGAARPPSVLVSELLDVVLPAVADGGSPAALARARARLVVRHPLSPFSAAAFHPLADPRLRSFDAGLAQALAQAQPPAPVPAPGDEALRQAAAEDGGDGPLAALAQAPSSAFFGAPLPAPTAEWRAVELEQLVEFFRQPCRYLLRRRLGVELPPEDDALAEEEPLLPDAASRRALARRLMPALQAGGEAGPLQRLAAAAGDYPEGRLGELLLRRELRTLSDWSGAQREAPAVEAPFACTLALDVDGEAWTLSAARADLRPDGLWLQRYGDLNAQDRLEAWLWHLWLCASRPQGVAPRTRWQARDGFMAFEPTAAPRARLVELLRLYREGLMRPLHFFPRAAWAFIDHKESLNQARAVWRGHPGAQGEGDDAAYRLALRGVPEPLDEAFTRCARAVFGVLRRCLKDGQG